MQATIRTQNTRVTALLDRCKLAPDETIRFVDHMPQIDGLDHLPEGIFCGLRDRSAAALMVLNPSKTLQCNVHYAIPQAGFLALPESICSTATRVALLEKMLPHIARKNAEDSAAIRLELKKKARPSTVGLVRWATCRHPQALLDVMSGDPSIRAVDCYVWVNRRAVRVLFFRAEEAQEVRVRWHDEIEAVLH